MTHLLTNALVTSGKSGPALVVNGRVRRWLEQHIGADIRLTLCGVDDPPYRDPVDVKLGEACHALTRALLKALPDRKGPQNAAQLVRELVKERDMCKRLAISCPKSGRRVGHQKGKRGKR